MSARVKAGKAVFGTASVAQLPKLAAMLHCVSLLAANCAYCLVHTLIPSQTPRQVCASVKRVLRPSYICARQLSMSRYCVGILTGSMFLGNGVTESECISRDTRRRRGVMPARPYEP